MMMRPKFEWDDRIKDPERLMRADARTARINRMSAINLRAASKKMIEKHPEIARWYLLVVDPNKEFTVEKTLSDAGVEALVPRTEGEVVIKKGQKIQQPDCALFPGYVLVQCCARADAFQGLKRTKHVVDFVGGMSGYHVVREEDVNKFKHFAGQLDAPRSTPDKTFKDGDKASIQFGPFFGLKCLVLAVKWSRKPYARVTVNVDGRAFEIERIPIAFLKKL